MGLPRGRGQPGYPHGSAATVHPYPVSQLEPSYLPPPPQPDPLHPQRASSLIGVLAASACVVILGGFIGVFFFPIFLHYEFPSFSILSASVSRFNLSSTNLTAD
ncbi:hypothetical protein MRB53_018274 [Persea americana]|uniref:Uncharacterized protein n=1 Tax=Persea americana TaxID=3435 RepID=A0ACC2M7H7_PERAE|nr:hypothetical protein MRB53_018274 [Persea americana]